MFGKVSFMLAFATIQSFSPNRTAFLNVFSFYVRTVSCLAIHVMLAMSVRTWYLLDRMGWMLMAEEEERSRNLELGIQAALFV